MVELVDVVDVKGIIAYDIGSGGQARLLIFGSAKVVVVEVLGAYHLLLHRCGEAYTTTRGYQKWHIGHSLIKGMLFHKRFWSMLLRDKTWSYFFFVSHLHLYIRTFEAVVISLTPSSDTTIVSLSR